MRLLALLLVAGCGSGSGSVPKNDAGMPRCANAVLAGTCVEAFFDPVADCFQSTGACTMMTDNQNYENICWAGGAKFIGTGRSAAHETWSNNGTVCVEADDNGAGFTMMYRGNLSLSYDVNKNVFTCGDGSTFLVGNTGFDCQPIDDVLDLPSLQDCTMGSCN